MTTGRETLRSRSVSIGTNGIATGTRRWQTEATSQAEAQAWISTAPEANGPTSYPGYPTLKLDNLSYEPMEGGTYDIVGAYSPTGLYTFEPINKTNSPTAFVRRYFSRVKRTIDVPIAVKEKRTIPGASQTTLTLFFPRKRVTPITNTQIHLKVRLARKLTLADSDLIASQTDKLHDLFQDSRRYLFVSGDVDDASDDNQFITYTWESDKGSKLFFTSSTYLGQPAIVYDNNGGNLVLPDVNRKPFEDWIAIVATTGPEFAPLFLSVPKYDFAQSGHLLLPGVTGTMFQ